MAKEKPAEKAPVFEKDALISAAKEFGTTPEVMAGALYDTNEPLTKDQAEKKVKDFLTRPIK